MWCSLPSTASTSSNVFSSKSSVVASQCGVTTSSASRSSPSTVTQGAANPDLPGSNRLSEPNILPDGNAPQVQVWPENLE